MAKGSRATFVAAQSICPVSIRILEVALWHTVHMCLVVITLVNSLPMVQCQPAGEHVLEEERIQNNNHGPNPRLAWMSYQPRRALPLFEPLVKKGEPGFQKVQGCSMQREAGELSVDDYKSNGYLSLTIRGGLNQQRKGIAHGVVLAQILNATLVVPQFEDHESWHTGLSFEDVYDVDHFINVLKSDVTIVRALPEGVDPHFLHNWSVYEKAQYLTIKECLSWFLPILQREGSIGIHQWHVQLVEDVPRPLQRLRCRANFHALKYKADVQKMGMEVHEKMREHGRFIALHLRFETDWTNVGVGTNMECKLNTTSLKMEPSYYSDVLCPLSPLEAAITLRALGANESTPIYLAGGDNPGAKRAMAPFHKAFPQVWTKQTLMPDKPGEALARFGAAIDHIVALESDLVVSTDERSNWAHIVQGQRYYESGNSKETFVMIRSRLKPVLFTDEVDMDLLTMVVREYRLGFYEFGCLIQFENTSPAFCAPQDCICNGTQTR